MLCAELTWPPARFFLAHVNNYMVSYCADLRCRAVSYGILCCGAGSDVNEALGLTFSDQISSLSKAYYYYNYHIISRTISACITSVRFWI